MEKTLDYMKSSQYFVIARMGHDKYFNTPIYEFYDKNTKTWIDEARLGTLFESKEALTSYRNKNREACKGGNMRALWCSVEGM